MPGEMRLGKYIRGNGELLLGSEENCGFGEIARFQYWLRDGRISNTGDIPGEICLEMRLGRCPGEVHLGEMRLLRFWGDCLISTVVGRLPAFKPWGDYLISK